MKVYFNQFLFSTFILCLGQASVVVNGQDDVLSFEQMKKKREEAIKVFESLPANTPVYTTTPSHTDSPQQTERPHQYSFEATPLQPKLKEQQDQQTEAKSEPHQQMISKQQPMVESPGYIHKLSRALPCFKQFIANLYQARYKRDFEITECATNGNEACSYKEASQFEKTSVTLTDQFYQCLDTREANQTANLSR